MSSPGWKACKDHGVSLSVLAEVVLFWSDAALFPYHGTTNDVVFFLFEVTWDVQVKDLSTWVKTALWRGSTFPQLSKFTGHDCGKLKKRAVGGWGQVPRWIILGGVVQLFFSPSTHWKEQMCHWDIEISGSALGSQKNGTSRVKGRNLCLCHVVLDWSWGFSSFFGGPGCSVRPELWTSYARVSESHDSDQIWSNPNLLFQKQCCVNDSKHSQQTSGSLLVLEKRKPICIKPKLIMVDVKVRNCQCNCPSRWESLGWLCSCSVSFHEFNLFARVSRNTIFSGILSFSFPLLSRPTIFSFLNFLDQAAFGSLNILFFLTSPPCR